MTKISDKVGGHTPSGTPKKPLKMVFLARAPRVDHFQNFKIFGLKFANLKFKIIVEKVFRLSFVFDNYYFYRLSIFRAFLRLVSSKLAGTPFGVPVSEGEKTRKKRDFLDFFGNFFFFLIFLKNFWVWAPRDIFLFYIFFWNLKSTDMFS